MGNRTCGECKYFVTSDYLDVCVVECETRRADSSCDLCDEFKPKVVTNGDRIRQMSNDELIRFLVELDANACQFCNHEKCSGECESGIKMWLDAPAESEGEDE